LPLDRGLPLGIPVPGGDQLVIQVDRVRSAAPQALVLLLHGLAGDSGRPGVRRLALLLQQAGFCVWRPNLRGAGLSRSTSRGTYAAACNADLLPLLAEARRQAAGQPLFAVGLSLGGTILLNALLEQPHALDGLACVSSPLDLAACSRQIDRPRNRLYARWLLRRLIAQTRADPAWADAQPADPSLVGLDRLRRIHDFDARITAPRWGYESVEQYYAAASPLPRLLAAAALPPLLLVHALDDPWVPALATRQLAAAAPLGVEVLLSEHGGHNGFHASGRCPTSLPASWADRAVLAWLLARGCSRSGAAQAPVQGGS
jgi:predicted alpha/beta-fold hydrolase